MAIFTTQGNSQPMEQTAYSVNLCTSSAAIPEFPPVIDFCYCDYDCDYRQLVLYGNNDYETDRSDFLIDIPDLTGSFEIYLKNIITGVEVQLLDNTYGTYFALGSFSTQPKKGGYLINWGLVASVLGAGRYKVRIIQNYFGQSPETISHEYNLKPYSATLANGTVKFEAVQNGCIIGGVDYTGMNWVSSVRFPAYFYEIDPRTEIESYQSLSRKVTQIQETTVIRYQLDTKLIPNQVLNKIKNDKLMADDIFITDYNLLSFEDLRSINVVRTEFNKFGTFRGSRKGVFSIVFEEKKQNKIKQ
jgi:hypothetical protein